MSGWVSLLVAHDCRHGIGGLTGLRSRMPAPCFLSSARNRLINSPLQAVALYISPQVLQVQTNTYAAHSHSCNNRTGIHNTPTWLPSNSQPVANPKTIPFPTKALHRPQGRSG